MAAAAKFYEGARAWSGFTFLAGDELVQLWERIANGLVRAIPIAAGRALNSELA